MRTRMLVTTFIFFTLIQNKNLYVTTLICQPLGDLYNRDYIPLKRSYNPIVGEGTTSLNICVVGDGVSNNFCT